MIAQRSKARGLSEADYMGGNLLGLEVTADDVAQCFVALAKAPKTTGAVLTGKVSHSGARHWFGLDPLANLLTLTADSGTGSARVTFQPPYV